MTNDDVMRSGADVVTGCRKDVVGERINIIELWVMFCMSARACVPIPSELPE